MTDSFGFSQAAFNGNQPGYSDRHPGRDHIPNINTGRVNAHAHGLPADMQTPGTGLDMAFTPLLPSNLLVGSPMQPQSPGFASPQFQPYSNFAQQTPQRSQNFQFNPSQQTMMTSQMYQNMMSPQASNSYMAGPQSPTLGSYGAYATQPMPIMTAVQAPMPMVPGAMSSQSRTVYLGNIPPDTPAEEILSHVRSGPIESVRLLADKNCAFISFLDSGSATHFHSDAILKKLCIKGQDIKIGWGKPSSVPTSVALAVQQSSASRNVYLGNLPEETSEDELREELSKFGPIDTVKIVREKAIGFVHFLSIGNAIKAVTQLPQELKWQPPRRVFYGKDRCAYVSKTQQQNAAQYLGIAPGFQVINHADRELISSALAQQSVAAAAVATTAGGTQNVGNRTVYLGNIHPETTIEEICNVVRGGLLHHVRYIPDKHICFVTFIDPTAAASFFALSNLQGLMIHNRRLKIGWGKHSGALPPAISMAVAGGASRNVYIGNLDETWTEERLRQDFSEFGEIELVNALREKSCAFVNFTNIANAIKAIEAVRSLDEYKRFKVNFGKDRCGNPPRHMFNAGQQQGQQQEGVSSPSPVNGFQPNRGQNISPASGSSNAANPLQGPTASAILNASGHNPLTLYLAATQQQSQMPQDSHSPQNVSPSGYPASPSQQSQHQPQMSAQQAFYSNENTTRSSNNSSLQAPSHFGHHATHSMNFGLGNDFGEQLQPTSLGHRHNLSVGGKGSSHTRTVSLPVFSQGPIPSQLPPQLLGQNQGFSGLGAGLANFGNNAATNGGYGLAINTDGGLPGWAEE